MLVHISWSVMNIRVSVREIFHWLKCLPRRHGGVFLLYQHCVNWTRDPGSLLDIQPSLITDSPVLYPVSENKLVSSRETKNKVQFWHPHMCMYMYRHSLTNRHLIMHTHPHTHIHTWKVVPRLFGWVSLRLTRSICISNKQPVSRSSSS